MKNLFLDILEINLVMTPVILLLILFSGRLRRTYGAKRLKALWILLAVRLAIPYNYTLPWAEVILLIQPDDVLPDFVRAGETEETGKISVSRAVTGELSAGSEAAESGKGGIIGEPEGGYDSSISFSGMDGENPFRKNPVTGADERNEITDGNGTDRNGGNTRNEVLVLIWVAGCALSLLYNLTGYLLFSAEIRRAQKPLKDPVLRGRIYRLQKSRMGKRVLPVYLCRGISSPMLTGLWHPYLLFPERKEVWTEEELALLLDHELYHYKQKDLWLKFLMLIARSIHWFNPAVYGMQRRFFAEMELACDSAVLEDRDTDSRERYARLMLSFCGKQRGPASFRNLTAFSTGFRGDKRKLRERIDCMMDEKKKKKGVCLLGLTVLLVVAMGLMVSCGYENQAQQGESRGEAGRPGISEDAQDNGQSSMQNGMDSAPDSAGSGQGTLDSAQNDMDSVQSSADMENKEESPFDYNNEYNEMLRRYKDDTYLSREDGIYRLRDGEEETCVFENTYEMRRGMELFKDALYFCGSCMRGEEQQATIYRMDLNTFAVEDLLAIFSRNFQALFGISIYEGNLYVAEDMGMRIGFALDEEGRIRRSLDETAEDFLFREYNEYMKVGVLLYEPDADNEKIWGELRDKYRALIDVGACKKMLGGNQVVQKYKDELMNSVYLETPEGEYEFLCDIVGFPVLVTETGVYYAADESGDIWYVDYETKKQEKIYEREEEEWAEILLVNYDAEYLYFSKSRHLGLDEDGNDISEDYLMRVPRAGGRAEEVFALDEGMNTFYLQSRSAIDENYIYFRDGRRMSLVPEENENRE